VSKTQTEKHSPGPWTAHIGAPLYDEDEYALGDCQVTAADDEHVADCGGLTNAPANARLIAAAPDLEYELGGVADALAGGQIVIIEPGSVKAERIRAAIAKAGPKGD